MIVVQVRIQIKPEHADAFEAATLENAQASAGEPGVVRFEFVKYDDEPDHYSLWEVYRDEHAVAAHKQTPHYARWAAATGDMMAAPRTRVRFHSVQV